MNKITQTILLGILTALLFSAFIYFEEYDLTNRFINTIFGISALALFLYIPKRSILIAGFLIGLLWFYWIGYSFEYQGVGYMTPIITLSFAVIYMLFFAPLYFTNKAYLRAILLFGLSFFEPFDSNWLQIELIFVDSYLGVFKYQLIIVLVALSLIEHVKLGSGELLCFNSSEVEASKYEYFWGKLMATFSFIKHPSAFRMPAVD